MEVSTFIQHIPRHYSFQSQIQATKFSGNLSRDWFLSFFKKLLSLFHTKLQGMCFSTSKNVLGIPGGPLVKTLCFQCRGLCSIPGGETKIPYETQGGKKKMSSRSVLTGVQGAQGPLLLLLWTLSRDTRVTCFSSAMK